MEKMEKDIIIEDYVSFETAKLLTEKGFNGNTSMYYKDNGNGVIQIVSKIILDCGIDEGLFYPALTLQMARKWLNKVKGISNYISCENFEERYYWVAYKRPSSVRTRSNKTFVTEEEAVEDLIQYCLTNLID